MSQYDASEADVFVYVRRQSKTLLSPLGHDLKIGVGVHTVEIEGADGFESAAVRARFDAASLRPEAAIDWESREETGGLSRGDRRKIRRRISREVLEAERFPKIEFQSTSVESTREGWRLRGKLALHGVDREIEFEVERRDGRAVGEVTLDMTEFGIEPFTALLGSLKVHREVVVAVDVPLPEGVAAS